MEIFVCYLTGMNLFIAVKEQIKHSIAEIVKIFVCTLQNILATTNCPIVGFLILYGEI